jgi:hypothetical protein
MVTISQVLGALPGNPVMLDSVTRPAVKTWLGRCGWQSSEYIGLDVATLQSLYSSPTHYWQLRGKVYDTVKGQTEAERDYNPRDVALREHLARQGHVLPPPRTGGFNGKRGGYQNGATTTASSSATEAAAAAAATASTASGEATTASTAGQTNIAAEIARLFALLGQQGQSGISEARVVELIRQHATVTHAVTVTNGEATKTVDGAHPKLSVLLQVLAAKDHAGRSPQVLLVGPTASGKTHAAEQAADALGLPFYLHGAMSMSHELLGFVDAAGNYHRTPFRDAFENGGVVLLDELDSWDASVTLALNAALANGVASFPDGMIRRHKDCIVIGAANTWGTGATAEYVGRTRLDAAFLSRFPVKITWERDATIEKAIAQDDTWAARVMAARERAAKAGLKHLIDPRHTAAGAALIRSGMSADMAAALTYQAGLSPEQVRMVEGV